MSEQIPERSGGGGNVFTRKIGPLPMWGWMGIALLLAVFYYLYKKNQGNNAQAQTAAPTDTTDQSLVPQFVNQTYVQETPPPAPNVTVNNQIEPEEVPPPRPPIRPRPIQPVNFPPTPANIPPAPAGTKPKVVTVTVGKFPSGVGGSPAAQEGSFGKGTAAWNSTLWGIATHYHVKGGYQTLAKLNHIKNPSLIYPGQKILVPVG